MGGPQAARAAVVRLGALPKHPRHLEDNLLLDAGGRLVAQGMALRVRRTPAGVVLTFKGPRQLVEGIKSREEIEAALALEHGDDLQRILERLGFLPVFRYQKYREAFAWRGCEIVVDETPIGTFLEIEGPIEEIHAAAAALGFSPADYVADSYAGLFLAAGGRGDMVFGE